MKEGVVLEDVILELRIKENIPGARKVITFEDDFLSIECNEIVIKNCCISDKRDSDVKSFGGFEAFDIVMMTPKLFVFASLEGFLMASFAALRWRLARRKWLSAPQRLQVRVSLLLS
jgi:hypothetical protein